MDEFECIDLRNWMLLTCAASRIVLHQLGNREWVLRTMQAGCMWHIWNYRDARAFCQDLEDKGRVTDTKRRATQDGKHRERVSV